MANKTSVSVMLLCRLACCAKASKSGAKHVVAYWYVNSDNAVKARGVKCGDFLDTDVVDSAHNWSTAYWTATRKSAAVSVSCASLLLLLLLLLLFLLLLMMMHGEGE